MLLKLGYEVCMLNVSFSLGKDMILNCTQWHT